MYLELNADLSGHVVAFPVTSWKGGGTALSLYEHVNGCVDKRNVVSIAVILREGLLLASRTA